MKNSITKINARLKASSTHTYTKYQLRRFFDEHRSNGEIPSNLSFASFVGKILKHEYLELVSIEPLRLPKEKGKPPYRTYDLYIHKKALPLNIALALRPGGYLSHATAAEHHGLLPPGDRIYANKEQSVKAPNDRSLSQEGIKRAFASAARETNLIYGYQEKHIYLVGGKNSDDYEVRDAIASNGTKIRVTSLERTLVDLAVRPIYAGGARHVVSAYRKAVDEVSIASLIQILKKLDHAYPFHQTLGFYLERAGASRVATKPLHEMNLTYDFYLDNKIKKPNHDPYWKIYYPPELDEGPAPPIPKSPAQKNSGRRMKTSIPRPSRGST